YALTLYPREDVRFILSFDPDNWLCFNIFSGRKSKVAWINISQLVSLLIEELHREDCGIHTAGKNDFLLKLSFNPCYHHVFIGKAGQVPLGRRVFVLQRSRSRAANK